ncbi:MAG: hypothetical protein HOQ32_18800 [Lysobacter sp.]|nr:hypothetical protein [Lysobacter sp.]
MTIFIVALRFLIRALGAPRLGGSIAEPRRRPRARGIHAAFARARSTMAYLASATTAVV